MPPSASQRYGRSVTANESGDSRDETGGVGGGIGGESAGTGPGRVKGISRRELEALSQAVLAVTGQTSTTEVLQQIVEGARELIDAEYAALGIPDDSGRFADFYAAGVDPEQWAAIGPVPRTHGMLGATLTEGRAQRIAKLRADSRFRGWPSAHPEMTNFLGVPIEDCDQTLGAIYLANKRGAEKFSADDEYLLRVLAAHAALALSRARMLERFRELTLIEERSRIARELHDAVAQKLFSLRLTVGAASTLVGTDTSRAAKELQRVKELAGSALDELRAVVTELRPPALREDGLVAALRKHVEVTGRAYDVDVRFSADCEHGCDLDLPDLVEDVVFRIAQEALHNALRHANPTTVHVDVAVTGADIRLDVTDDGVGLPADAAASGGQHLGIMSMRERARHAGGRLRVLPRPEGGTRVRLEVPLG